MDQPGWQALRNELHPHGLEVVTVALDVDPEQARPWIEQAKPEHPSLIDRMHVLDALFGIVNVPMSVWIDERGMIVRPPEVSNIEPPRFHLVDFDSVPPERLETIEEARRMLHENEPYVAALRDWVANGSASRYALSPDEVLARSEPRSMEKAEAAAHFELGEHLLELGDVEASQRHWREAHRRHPDNWTYKRQAWELVAPGTQARTEIYEGSMLEDVRKIGPENYYPPFRP